MNRRNMLFALFTVVGVVIDQGTKAWVVANIEERVGRIQVIPGFFDIVHAKNPGAAFGLLGDFEYRHLLFYVFTAVAGYVVYDLYRKLDEDDTYMASALGLITSGAIGNLIDRIRIGEVTDFLRFYTESPSLVATLNDIGLGAEYPSFNVADAALVVGVGMLVVHYLFFDDSRKQADESGENAPEPAARESAGQEA